MLDIPDLTFPRMKYGVRETPLDLKPLLYLHGAKADVRKVGQMIADGQLGNPRLDRVELVAKMHDMINGELVGGGSAFTTRNLVRHCRKLFQWAEDAGHEISLDSVQTVFFHWTDALDQRHRVSRKTKQVSAYTLGSDVGRVLDGVFDRPTPLIHLSRLRAPRRRPTAQGPQAEKQDLEKTFKFGHFLQDICDSLPIDVVLNGPLPVRIKLRDGGELVQWSRYNCRGNPEQYMLSEGFLAYQSDGTLRTRYPLANLRIEAELLMFIGQTGMNVGQAHKLKLRNFSYHGYLDGYQVLDRKNRRGGEVLFEIFKEYQPHFERFLCWRRQLFPKSDRLFPFVEQGRSEEKDAQFRLRTICKTLGTSFVTPRALRGTRVNWLLRRSGDPELTASMAQHSKEVLLANYDKGSLQRTMSESMRFWSQHDPVIARTESVAPGECNARPEQVPEIPKNAPKPDCIRPSGCLWCFHHRDIDSKDYVWSLACFRHLKIIEVSKRHSPRRPPDDHPAQHAIDRTTEKLRWFDRSNAKRRAWTREAIALVEEGTYHQDWRRLIEELEGTV